ncbi:hypothetical protein FJTKL_10154 [Diaporthe vaccinii]|uniref:Uncharacterized protein n=1 Tax=Diaporthe vaccinii TaxID=105482 RepID=A0ABR4EKR9_9PEZI
MIPSYLPPSLRLPPNLTHQSGRLRLFAPFFFTLWPPFFVLLLCFVPHLHPICTCLQVSAARTHLNKHGLSQIGGINVESKSKFWNLALFFLIPVSRTGPGLPSIASIRSALGNPYPIAHCRHRLDNALCKHSLTLWIIRPTLILNHRFLHVTDRGPPWTIGPSAGRLLLTASFRSSSHPS